MKKIIFISSFLLFSFTIGFFVRGLLQTPEQQEQTNIEEQPDQETALPEKKEKTIDQDTQKKYYELIAEYMSYINERYDREPISFQDFVNIKKSRSIQDNNYSEEDEKLYNKILEWYSYLNDQEEQESEISKYKIYGEISTLKKQLLRSSDAMVGVFNNPTYKNMPTVPIGHICFERPKYYSYADPLNRRFEIDVTIKENADGVSDPIYILSMLIPNTVPYNTSIVMSGGNNKTDGVPVSMLSRKKDNKPLKLKLNEPEKRYNSSTLNIKNIHPNNIVWVYGLDLISKLYPEMNITRSVISGIDGVARITKIPSSSVLMISSPNHKTGFNFETAIAPYEHNITLLNKPYCSTNSCVCLIRPLGFDDPEVSIYSKNPYFKKTIKFKNSEFININTPIMKDAILELRSNGQSFGIMKINSKPETTSLIEPVHKNIQELLGKINKIVLSPYHEAPCRKYKINVMLTENESNTDMSGEFRINDIDTINNYLDILVEGDDVTAKINIPVIHHHEKLNFNTNIPCEQTIRTWEKILPNTKNNSFIYGEIPYHKSYKAFLIGDNNETIKEAYYFNSAMIPDKKTYSTVYDPTNKAFSRFLFSDIKEGKYILYLISGNELIHSRILSVESNRTVVLN